MAMHADRHKRSGDEFYTPAFIVERLALSYKNIFDKYNYIWLPFNSFDKPMYKVMKKYYGEKVIATKGNFFDVFHNNVSDILNIVNKYKVLVFDNPPFSKSIKIIKFLDINNSLFYSHPAIDFVLFGNALMGLTFYKNFKICYDILGSIPFDNSYFKNQYDKRIAVALLSNLFTEIKYNFYIKPEIKLEYDKTINLKRFIKDEKCILSSASIMNLAQRGYIFDPKRLRITNNKKFGGDCYYDFPERNNVLYK